MRKRILKSVCSLILVITMLIPMVPFTVFAEDTTSSITESDNTQTDTIIKATDVASSEQLEQALSSEASAIRIVGDFTIDRTFYIANDVTIYSDEAHTLTRAADFAGDIFVVGEAADGTACESRVTLTLGNATSDAKDLLTIDGNSENMTVNVVGTVVFVCSNGQADLYENLTIKNNKKVGNERALIEAHGLTNTAYIGGAAGILSKDSIMNIYGGTYTNNSVNTETESVYGGAFYNFSTLNVYGGLFENNSAVRAGAFYNYRTLNIYNAEIKNNSASSMGGAIYAPASTGSFTYIGAENDVVESSVTFTDNSAVDGGAILCQATMDIKNTTFEGNTASETGGAVYCSNNSNITVADSAFTGNTSTGSGGALYISTSVLDIANTDFEENSSGAYGGAIYMTGQSDESETVDLNVKNSDFIGNSSVNNGGALYLAGTARAYLSKANFSQNKTTAGTSSANGGAVYCTNSTLEINGAEFTSNSGYNGGTVYLNTSANATFNNITVNGNTAQNNGGFVYSLGGTLKLYNSTIENNTATNGGAMYLYTNAVSNVYNTVFNTNEAKTSGGALFIYTNGTKTLLHSNTFQNNTANTYGGALQISGVSLVDIFSTTVTSNSASYGGFMYETKAGTVVNIADITLSGNTATTAGPIIYGNTLNATLNIDKSSYTDNDATAELDDTYWASAIANKLTVNDVSTQIPEYDEYEQPESDTEVSPDVRSATQLERALAAGFSSIRIIADFKIDRTFYITKDVTIYSDEAHTLKRASDFAGDIFVVGEAADGTACENRVTLTLGNKDSDVKDLLTINGNSENMTAQVVGTVIFVCSNGQADLYENLTITNNKKVGNERAMNEAHGLTNTSYIGGAAGILSKDSIMNIYGGTYTNNSVNTSGQSVYGGAFYNFSTLNVYGGLFENNSAVRAGAFYNYRTLNLYNAEIKNNSASSMGGAIYAPASTGSFTYIGGENDVVESSVTFTDNSAVDGGAILCQATMDIENAIFEGNTATETGGALCCSNKSNVTVADSTFTGNTSTGSGGAIYSATSVLDIENTTFEANVSDAHGGAVCATGQSEESETVDLSIKNSEFIGNITDNNGGALYLSGTIRAYLSDVNFRKNTATSSTSHGGAVYTSNTTLEIDGADFTSNTAYNGGAVTLNTTSTANFNNITASDNTARKLGGFVYNNTSEFNLYNSTVSDNSAYSGGAVYLYTDAKTGIYNTLFEANTSETSGGAVYVSTGETETLMHSCTFADNTAATYGGAVYVSDASTVKMYNSVATGNNASRGGVLYETTYGTTVTVNGLTVSGNTAELGGSVIYGNTANATLNINKTNYTDSNVSEDLDEAYWSDAIAGRLTVNEITEDIPDYLDYGNESAGDIKDACAVSTAQELEDAILQGEKYIQIVADFEIDRTFYISGDTTIFSTKAHTLTRSADFAGDIFVIGEDTNHTSALLLGGNAKLTLGNPSSKTKNLLTIDGNKDNMNVEVTGTVLFICYSSEVSLYDNVTVTNCYKTGNEKTLDKAYGLTSTSRIGGAVAIIGSGTLNIYGGIYKDNMIKDEDTSTEEGRASTYGGAIYNTSNLRIYGGTFEGNQGPRGGVIYNYRITEIYGGSFEGNHATVNGGVVYSPSSAASHLIIGNDANAQSPVTFTNNSSESNGGVIYSPTLCAVVIKNTVFEGNSSDSNGGVICVYGQLTARNVTFRGNKAHYRGGAVYLSNSDNEVVTRYVNLTDCQFIDNQATLGGAVSMYASSMDYTNGAIATITNCEFTYNTAVKQKATSTVAFGGAIYTDRKASLTVKNSHFTGNTADLEGGAIYTQNQSAVTVTGSEFTENLTVTETGNGGAITVKSSQLDVTASDFYQNNSMNYGGAMYISYVDDSTVNSEVTVTDSLFAGNESANGGAIYATKHETETDTRVLTVKNTDLEENIATQRGGAVYITDAAEAYLNNVYFALNTADSSGGAVYSSGGKMEIDGAVFSKNTSVGTGGAITLTSSADMLMNDITATGNIASSNGGFVYSTGGILNLYNSNIKNNSAASGGAMYLYTDAVSNIYNTVFDSNAATASAGNGGALFIYTNGTETLLHSNTFKNNTANNYGGALQISGVSLVKIYNTTATANSAAYGGFMYETKAGTDVILADITLSGNTATTAGPIIYGNTLNATLNIDKSSYTDTDATTELDDAYWASAIANKLTVNEATVEIPAYEPYVGEPQPEDEPTEEKEPVSVQDVLSLGLESSDEAINSTYNKLPRLDNSSNFMSKSTSKYDNINGNTVTVDTFVYHDREVANNGNVGEGLLIYQALLYKQANPEEDVYIDIASYRFSVQAAVNINRNSRYFGYMRDLADRDYDEYGFVRISYLLITAAKMGIHVNVIGQRDAYPISSSTPNLYDYFTSQLGDPCDPDYAKDSVIRDYMNFDFCYWTLFEKGGTDMMHTKLCAVSHYLDMNGVEHKNAVWTSSANLDGVRASGVNGNWKQQTSSIVSDHEEIYRISVNYLRLIADYCEQEEVYEFQHLVNTRSTEQIDLILAGREDEIPEDEKIVYIGSETDDVFELYFTPLGGGAVVWDEEHNPYCKYLREMYNSEDYILFTWNAAEYSGNFTLGQQMERMIIESFHKNKNPKNKIYANIESFDATTFDDLVVGEDIGFKSFNQYDFGEIHNKDVQVSYVKDGQRYFVTLLNSLNFHSGAMSYQSNFILVVKEKACDENSVFSTIANETTKGDIAAHSFGEEYSVEPANGKHGYTYHTCEYCGLEEQASIIHVESDWIIDRQATSTVNGIRHKECLLCGMTTVAEEIPRVSIEIDATLAGKTFTADSLYDIGDLDSTPKTIEATINVPKSMSERVGTIVGNYDASKNAQLNLEIYTEGRVRLFFNTGTTKVKCLFNTDIRSDSAVHVAVTVTGNTATLYVDGVKTETAPLKAELPAVTDNFKIGGDNRELNEQYFKGTVYAVNMFSDVRTEAEIERDALLVTGDSDALLYSQYFMGEGSTQTPTPVLLSGKTFTADTLYNLGDLSATPKTIEAIINVPKSMSERAGTIVGNYDASKNAQLSLEIYTEGRVRLFYNTGTTKIKCLFNTDIRSDSAVHVAVTVSGNTATLYVNGVKTETITLKAELPTVTNNFKLGGDNRALNEQYFKGTVYAVNMFSDVRTAAEISKDAVLVTPDTPDLIYTGYYTNKDSNYKVNLVGQKFEQDNIYAIENNLSATPKTIEAIINVPKSMNERVGTIVGNYDASKNTQMNLEVYTEGRVRLFYNNGTTKVKCLFSTDIRSDSATHIAVTVLGKNATLYVNGVKAETIALKVALPTVTDNFKIGGDNRVGNEEYFKGTIYSVTMFSDVRVAVEITKDAVFVEPDAPSLIYSRHFASTLCSASVTGSAHVESDWIVDYPMTETQHGIKHTECTACGDTLKISEITGGDSTFSVNYADADGLDSTEGSYKIDDTLSSKPVTLEVMLQLPTTYDDRAGVVLGNYDGGDNDQINFEIYSKGRPRLYYKSGGTAYSYIFKTDIRSDRMTHVAITIDGLTARLYLDGELKESVALEAELPDVTEGFRIGSDNRSKSPQYFKGVIYSVNMFSDVKTSEEVRMDAILVSENAPNLMYSKYFLS